MAQVIDHYQGWPIDKSDTQRRRAATRCPGPILERPGRQLACRPRQELLDQLIGSRVLILGSGRGRPLTVTHFLRLCLYVYIGSL
ncbi:hypothetical protein J6590_102467 [Homalodisca vitripennis]|nr:hypothetical protein J6590_102467 [Homalodisca vitripennis]